MTKSGWACNLLLSTAFGILSILNLGGQSPTRQNIRVYFSALNKEEKPVMGLKPTDFELRIDGKQTAMADFRAALPPSDRSIPLAAWILIGYGPTIKSQVIERQANAAASAFLKLHPASVMGIKLISDRSETLSPMAHDPRALRSAIMQYSQRRAELDVGIKNASVALGDGGMMRAVDLAMDELDVYISAQPSLRDQEVHRAIMMICAGDINPNYKLKPLLAKAARQNVFLFPVYVPTSTYGLWVQGYFDLAKKTAGVASVEGALKPGSNVFPLPRSNQAENALDVNFIHLVRDVNGKYSFSIQRPPDERERRIELKCKVKGIEIRLPRTNF